MSLVWHFWCVSENGVYHGIPTHGQFTGKHENTPRDGLGYPIFDPIFRPRTSTARVWSSSQAFLSPMRHNIDIFRQLQRRRFHSSHLQGVKVYKEKRPPQEAADGQEAPTKGGGYITEKNLVCPNPCYNIMLYFYSFFFLNSIVTAKR